MGLTLITAPVGEPLTYDEVKTHLRVTTDEERGLIEALTVAAREYAEVFTRRALLTQTWDYTLDEFPCYGNPIELPLPPLQSVTSVSYVDANGDSQTWATTNYTVEAPAGPRARAGRIIPNYSVVYPTTRSIENAVTIRFIAGYGTKGDVPQSIRAAMKVQVTDLFTLGRQSILTGYGSIVAEVPKTGDVLLWPFKVFR